MILVSVLFFVYFFLLMMFFLVSHPVYYCGVLVVKALVGGLICYFLFGFSWYTLLFCLVYVGGVYILFVFVSIYRPKSRYIVNFNISVRSICLVGLVLIIVGAILIWGFIGVECSAFLCTCSEGIFYVLVCLTLLFGFIILSMVMRVKLKYYR